MCRLGPRVSAGSKTPRRVTTQTDEDIDEFSKLSSSFAVLDPGVEVAGPDPDQIPISGRIIRYRRQNDPSRIRQSDKYPWDDDDGTRNLGYSQRSQAHAIKSSSDKDGDLRAAFIAGVLEQDAKEIKKDKEAQMSQTVRAVTDTPSQVQDQISPKQMTTLKRFEGKSMKAELSAAANTAATATAVATTTARQIRAGTGFERILDWEAGEAQSAADIDRYNAYIAKACRIFHWQLLHLDAFDRLGISQLKNLPLKVVDAYYDCVKDEVLPGNQT